MQVSRNYTPDDIISQSSATRVVQLYHKVIMIWQKVDLNLWKCELKGHPSCFFF